MRVWLKVLPSLFLSFSLGVVGGCGDAPAGRRILLTQWDTVLVLGSSNQSDTTLVRPAGLLVIDTLLFVFEDLDQQVRAFNTQTGQWEWTFGRRGEGPGELAAGYGVFVGPDGTLRIWDSRNRKLLTVDLSGSFLGEMYFRDLWGLSGAPQVFGDRMIWVQLSESRPNYISTLYGGDPVDSVRIQWPVPDNLPYSPSLFTQTAGAGSEWAMGLREGPYFAVGNSGGVTIHPFIEPVPYAYAPNQSLSQRDPAADSTRWGARDLEMTDSEIFVLTGGRPPKVAYEEQPSRLLDVYGIDGTYQYTLNLPFDAHAFATADGETFYVITSPTTGTGLPRIYGLRPRRH